MSITVRETKWKKKVSNKRIGMSSVENVPMSSVENLDSQMGNTNFNGYAAKRPKQGRRM